MDKLTRKGPGRPRKLVAISDAAAEGQDAPCHDDGNRETGGAGLAAQADDAGTGSGGMGGLNAFLVKLDAVIRSNGRDYIASATHPDADGETLDADYSVTISKGPAQVINKHGHPINI